MCLHVCQYCRQIEEMLELIRLFDKFEYRVELNPNVLVCLDRTQLMLKNTMIDVDDQVMNVRLNTEYQMKKNQYQNHRNSVHQVDRIVHYLNLNSEKQIN